MNGRRFWMALLLALAMCTPLAVHAHGGGELVVTNAPVGEYTVSVWVNPPIPRANEAVHFTVGIAGADQAPVLDAAVSIEIRTADLRRVEAFGAATTAQSVNRLFYEADFQNVTPGDYQVDITIEGSDSSGSVTLPLTVASAAAMRWVIPVLTAVGVAALALVLFSWTRQRQPASPVPRPRHR